MTLDTERVHVLRERDPEAQRAWFRAALAALVKVRAKETIAIKPNLGSALPEQTGATTALWMIEETVRYVRKRRGIPVVVEGPSHIQDYAQVLEATGASRLFAELDVEHVDARQQTIQLRPPKHDDAAGRVYHVALAALGADGIICLPKLKTHNRTGATLGMKGLMGLLSPADRHGFHRRGVDEDVVELYHRLRGRIRATFVDGIVGMEGHGPTGGRPVPMDLIVAGTDMVSVDTVCARIMGFEPEDIEHVRLAAERGLGSTRRPWQMHPAGLPLPTRYFERPRPDSGLRTQLMTFPPLSAALRSGRMGVRGRTKPVLRAVPLCDTCTLCADICPTRCIEPPHRLDYAACIGCRLCIDVCPEGALSPEARVHKLGRVVRELLA